MKRQLLVEYDSNNSGGSFWLKDDDWNKLEKAGWKVQWGERMFEDTKYHPERKGKKRPKTYSEAIRREKSGEDGIRWLGTLACTATKKFDNIKEALLEFEKITGQSVTDEGCNCCGSPHSFTWSSSGCTSSECKCEKGHKDYNYGSGESLSQYLYQMDNPPTNLREALELLSKQPTIEAVK